MAAGLKSQRIASERKKRQKKKPGKPGFFYYEIDILCHARFPVSVEHTSVSGAILHIPELCGSRLYRHVV
jgi:hypothetical protein